MRSKTIHALVNRRMAVILCLGFASGLPLALTGTTLQAWMQTEKIDLKVIGLFSLVGLPYALKFLWSPLMDRYIPPFLGRRRGWIALCQLVLVLVTAAMALLRPATQPHITALLAFFMAFFSASQDIVIDAYRTDVLEQKEMGWGAALHIAGYRVAMLTSGALALILADHLPWRIVYLAMAGALIPGMLANFFGPEPKVPTHSPRTLQEAVVQPFVEFFRRPGAFEILAFIIFYKLDAVIATSLTTPFMMELGFTKTDIGAVNKGFGFIATILGTMTGGAVMVKLGMKRSLWIFGILQGISGFSFWLLAHLGHHYPAMVTAIAVENFFTGMGTAAYSGFMMSLCDKRFTATQYALLTSFMALTRVIGSAPTGYMARAWGWEAYFLVSIFAMIPGLLILTRFEKWKRI